MAFEPTEQQSAILAHDPTRHARVLSGPGTGKSTTMVALLGRVLEENNSLRVRMLTFTRAATAELAEKIAIHSKEAERPSTIHSFAISVLLRNPGTGGFPEPLRIADTWESKNIVHPTLAKRIGVQVTILKKWIQEMASNWESLTDEKDPKISDTDRTRFRGAWTEHRQILGYTLLAELPYALRRALHNHDDLVGINFDLLLVDEYQDLNSCDLNVIKLLSDKGGCAVIGTGDDDQSIYRWRNAAPEGIRRFLKDYSNAEDYSLSVTLRCGKRVIDWANYVIQGDPDRPSNREVLSTLPDSPEGEVALLHFPSNRTEAKGIAELVNGLIDEGVEPKDILVLMRTDHNQMFSKPIREALEECDIPCSDPSYVLDLLKQLNNRQLLVILRLLIDRNDSIAWASLLYLTRDVGITFYQHIYDRAKDTGVTFSTELLSGYNKSFPDAPSSSGKAKIMMDSILPWLTQHDLPDEQPEQGWGHWIVDLCSDDDFMREATDDFKNLLLNLDELLEEQQSLGRYLGQIEPLGKDLAQAQSEGVRIMTMGGSKGLTVRATIIAGVENGLIPRPGCTLSEERRILYVAMTRSKEYLFCTWANSRHGPTARAGHSSLDRRCHSEFLDDGPVQSENGQRFFERRFEA